jgi:hypothetical protein
MARRVPFSEGDLRTAIEQAVCWSDALRFLGYSPKGSNYRTLQNYAKRWNIPANHFDRYAGQRRAGLQQQVPLDEVLVKGSSYPRGKLKSRLFAAGLKQPICELCGQDENWVGRRMSLILDHVNGVSNDNRFENLRVVCPNCAATLDTHCGRNIPRERICVGCGNTFTPHFMQHRYCTQRCWGKIAASAYRGKAHPETRKVPRPSCEQLMADVESMSMVAVGRKYGVSDNAVRKWIRWYEYRRAQQSAETDDLAA